MSTATAATAAPSNRKDPRQIVEETWKQARNFDGFAEKFYNTLFELEPKYKETLFKGVNVKVQALMLKNMLDVAVNHINQPDILIPNLRDLGMRHCRYGCRLHEYEVGGIAFQKTLAHFFGDKFTPEVCAAWKWTYEVIQAIMVATTETEEGRRMLEEHDAKIAGKPLPPLPAKSTAPPAAAASAAASQPPVALFVLGGVAVGVAASVAVTVLLLRKGNHQ